MANTPDRPLSQASLTNGRREPPRTIYGPTWSAAQRAIGDAAPRDQPLLHELLYQIEAGWMFVRPIMEMAHAEPSFFASAPAVGDFAIETAEFFRTLADTCARWVTGAGAENVTAPSADTDSMEAELHRFANHAAVLALAGQQAGLDGVVSGVLQRLGQEAPPWADRMTALVHPLGVHWDLPPDP